MALSNKSHPESGPEGKQAKADAQASDPTLAEVQRVADKEAEQGFRGVEADPTPNENYSVSGVTSGAPTPETDKEQAKKVREHQDVVQAKVDGVSGQGN
jgi:hypothetical protein